MFNAKNYVRLFFASLTMFLLMGLTACHDDDDDPVIVDTPTPTATVQVIHASPNAPAVNVLAAGSALLESFDYGNASGQVTIDAGMLNVDVQALLPDGSTPSVIGPVDLDFAENTDTLVIALNTVDAIEPLVIARDDVDVASDMTRVRIIHAAPAAPQVDIYVTAPDAVLANEAALATASFKDETGEVEVASGDYRIRITPANSSDVVFDSGTVALPGGADLAILAIENTKAGDSPVQLLIAGEGADSSFYVRDANTPVDLRVVHASPDAPAVDVVVNDGFAAPLVPNLPFAGFAGFVEVPPAMYNVKVVPTGTTTPAVINADLDLMVSENYTVYAVDVLANIEPLVLSRDLRRIGTEAKIDIVHASPAAGNVDIYVTAPGTDISGVDATLTNVPFKADTDFISLPAGMYDVTVTPTGSKTAAIGPATITLANGGIYTAVAIDEVRTTADPDGLPPGLLLLDDFLAE